MYSKKEQPSKNPSPSDDYAKEVFKAAVSMLICTLSAAAASAAAASAAAASVMAFQYLWWIFATIGAIFIYSATVKLTNSVFRGETVCCGIGILIIVAWAEVPMLAKNETKSVNKTDNEVKVDSGHAPIVTASSSDNLVGLSITPIDGERCSLSNISRNDLYGVQVENVAPNSLSSRLDLRTCDIIQKYNNEVVHDPAELISLISRAEPGVAAELTINRGGSKKSILLPINQKAH